MLAISIYDPTAGGRERSTVGDGWATGGAEGLGTGVNVLAAVGAGITGVAGVGSGVDATPTSGKGVFCATDGSGDGEGAGCSGDLEHAEKTDNKITAKIRFMFVLFTVIQTPQLVKFYYFAIHAFPHSPVSSCSGNFAFPRRFIHKTTCHPPNLSHSKCRKECSG